MPKLPATTLASRRLTSTTGIAVVVAVASTLIGLPVSSAVAASAASSPTVPASATTPTDHVPAPPSASTHPKPPAGPPTATASPAEPNTKGWSSTKATGKTASPRTQAGTITASPMTGGVTYTLMFQQAAWRQGYSTAHYWMDGVDLGSFDSAVVTSTTQ